MGTRADFYVGRGQDAEWIGSIAWDGYPEGIPDEIKEPRDEKEYRVSVGLFISGRDDGTLPEMGWPWPWQTSHTTDYAYAFDAGVVYASNFGYGWYEDMSDFEAKAPEEKICEFPDMSDKQKVTLGKRSGVFVLKAKIKEEG